MRMLLRRTVKAERVRGASHLVAEISTFMALDLLSVHIHYFRRQVVKIMLSYQFLERLC